MGHKLFIWPMSLLESILYLRSIIRVLLALKLTQIGRCFYDSNKVIKLDQSKLEIWPGFTTSIFNSGDKLLLTIDISHRVLRTETVYDFFMTQYSRDSSNFKQECQRRLVGEIILTRYNNKTYRIDDIDFSKKPTDSFELFNGEKITYMDYYLKNYQIKIRYPDQPLLVSLPKKIKSKEKSTIPLHLIPELCCLTGLTDDLRSNFHIMKELDNHTKMSPENRVRALDNFIRRYNENDVAKKGLTEWGFSMDKSLVKIASRVLPTEKVVMNTTFTYQAHLSDWSRDLRNYSLLKPVSILNWALIAPNKMTNDVMEFVHTLIKASSAFGVQISKPKMQIIANDRIEAYNSQLKSCITNDLSIVLICLSSQKKDCYDSVKKICCVERPIPSQVVVGRTITKKPSLMSVASKVGLQMAVKIGAEPWAVEIPLNTTMIVGIDVCHDKNKKNKSFCGFVASMNKQCTKYYSRVSAQPGGTEIVDSLLICMKAALTSYNSINGALPQKILVYRDGVGDGQISAVIQHEVAQIKNCVNMFYGTGTSESIKPAQLGVIIVRKRINTKIFIRNSSGISNPLPGTIVDNTITRNERPNFYLVSQCVGQGTVNPTHYIIALNESGLNVDQIQRLSYKLTHLYANWAGTIRVPAPCQYAHKLAYLAGQSLRCEPNITLSNRLFYL